MVLCEQEQEDSTKAVLVINASHFSKKDMEMKDSLKGFFYILIMGMVVGLGAAYVPTFMIGILCVFMLILRIRLWALCKFEKYESCVKIWSVFTGLTAVRVMDYNHDVTYTLVKQQSDGSYIGHQHFILESGSIRLMPNGFVDPECNAAWCYIWQPLNSELHTQLQLSWDSWPNWDSWKEMDHLKMVAKRRAHFKL